MAKKAEESQSKQLQGSILDSLADAAKGMVSASQAARQLELSPQRLSILCQQGRLQGARKIGISWFIPQASVDEFAKIKRVHGRRLSLDKVETAEPPPPKKTSKKKPKK